MALKTIWAVAAAAAVAVGLLLPVAAQRVDPPSQIQQLEVRR